jgi:hypothetical protein
VVESKSREKLTDRVFHVEVDGLSSSLWRRIRVPGTISLKEFGKIIRTAFAWAPNSWGVFEYPGENGYPPQPLMAQETNGPLTQIFRSTGDLLLFAVYRGKGREPRWAHLVRCIAFKEPSRTAMIENGAGEAVPPGMTPVTSVSSFAAILIGGNLPTLASSVAPFDLVAANERLLDRAGAQKRVPYAQNRCRALVLIDSRPIRNEWERTLRDLTREIEKLEKLIRNHDEVDAPAFQVWLRKRFGPMLARIQQARERLAELTQRLRLLSILETKFQGLKSKAELYRLALAIEAGKAPWPEDPEDESENDRELEHMARNASRMERDFFEAQLRRFEDEFGEMPEAFDELRDIFKANDANDVRERCKSVYRKIVLLLHPDRIGVLDPSKLDLWHRTQNAYENADLVTLEAILDGCVEEVKEKSIAELQQAVEERRQQIERLKTRLSVMKKEPTWNFSNQKGKKLTTREQRVRREIDMQCEEIEFGLQYVKEECAQFERAWRKSESSKAQVSKERSKARQNEMELF